MAAQCGRVEWWKVQTEALDLSEFGSTITSCVTLGKLLSHSELPVKWRKT